MITDATPGRRLTSDTVLALRGVSQHFDIGGGRTVYALNDVSIDVRSGETLGIVGESGCGKSTLLQAILQAPRPTQGSVVFEGVELTRLGRRDLDRVRPRIGMVFQDPSSSLDPRFKVREIVAEPLVAQGMKRPERAARVDELVELVGLDPVHHGDRLPSQLSGGQLQRVAIARALAVGPSTLLCDEVVSSLDVSIQAQILNVFETVRQERSLASVFVSHDLAVVRHVSDRISVMYLGSTMEIGPADEIHDRPVHPYTEALLSSSPQPPGTAARQRIVLQGEIPSPVDPPSGCSFRTRCPRAEELCAVERPVLRPFGDGHVAACHFPLRAPSVTATPQELPA
ncbi:MAG: ATP-binding cassette domain-containing protein [Ilumatobacteraceae bacterium]